MELTRRCCATHQWQWTSRSTGTYLPVEVADLLVQAGHTATTVMDEDAAPAPCDDIDDDLEQPATRENAHGHPANELPVDVTVEEQLGDRHAGPGTCAVVRPTPFVPGSRHDPAAP